MFFFMLDSYIGEFSQQAKSPGCKVVFDYVNFFDLTSVSAHGILFPLNFILRIFFGMMNCTLRARRVFVGAMKYFRHILTGHEIFFKIFDGPRNMFLCSIFIVLFFKLKELKHKISTLTIKEI